MSRTLLVRASILSNLVRLSSLAAMIILVAACGTDSESIPAEINNEILQVSLEPGVSYEARVRAISANNTGPWSETFLLETDNTNEDMVAVTYIDPEYVFQDEINGPPVENQSYDPYFEGEFYDPQFEAEFYTTLFNDFSSNSDVDSVEPSVVPGTSEFTGVPMFSWEHDGNALAYEFEIIQTDTLTRVGVFQYSETSVCIEGSCQIVLDNVREINMELPPIPLIGGTVVEGEAPYTVTIPSPVTQLASLSTTSHFWSIEGSYQEFPDAPELQHTFSDPGSYTVNVVVTSAEGRSEYAFITVNASQQTQTASGSQTPTTEIALATVTAGEDTPEVSAALPTESEGNIGSDSDSEVNELQAPVVSVSAPELPAVSVPVTAPVQEPENPSAQEPIVEQTVVEPVAVSETVQETTQEPVQEVVQETTQVPVPEVVQETTQEPVPEVVQETTQEPAQETVQETIESEPATSTTANSVSVSWELSNLATGQIEWGYTPDNLDQSTVKELSFRHDAHTQRITGLAPLTTIFLRVIGEFSSGVPYSSGVVSATTTEAVAVSGWDDSMPLGGRAIGVVTYGVTTGNNKLVAHKHSRRFLATRSGEVKAFRWVNRVLLAFDIENRAANNPLPIWKEVQDAVGNDPMRGGYMLSNSYSVGNGGLQEVSIQTDSGAPDHLPTGDIIAIAEPFIPFDLPHNKVTGADFKEPVSLEAGKLYHLVFNNLNPPNTKLGSMTAEEARNAPIDKGAIALDGPHAGTAIDPEERHGPFLRDFSASFTRSSATAGWRSSNVVPWYSLIYADDIEVGEMYAHIHGQGAYAYYVEGNSKLRQEFTWDQRDISVDRIVTRFGHKTSANGQPMSILVKDQSGATIATASFPFDSQLRDAASDSDYWKKEQTRSAVSYLSRAVTLVRGQRYFVEYSAPSGAGFKMSPALDVIHTRHGSNDWNVTWGDNARAMQSKDGTNWIGLDSFVDSDLAMYLIPVGIPTQTPRP